MARTELNTDLIKDSTIVNADIDAAAAIAGSKINPAFGLQNLSFTGHQTIAGTAAPSGLAGTARIYFDSGTNKLRVSENGGGFVDLVLSAGVAGSGVASRVAFWSASNTLSSNANLYWDDLNSRLGIGITTPLSALHVSGQIRHEFGIVSEGAGPGAVVGNARGTNATDLQSARGSANQVASGSHASLLGGSANRASGDYSVVSGGINNVASFPSSTVSGGNGNSATNDFTTVSGGGSNTASGNRATVGGGVFNTASGYSSTVAGGNSVSATADYSSVGGGASNLASGLLSTVPGGNLNTASGDYSFAAGNRAKAVSTGAFVWADSTAADFTSTVADSFILRASGGFGVGTASPESTMDVAFAANKWARFGDQAWSTRLGQNTNGRQWLGLGVNKTAADNLYKAYTGNNALVGHLIMEMDYSNTGGGFNFLGQTHAADGTTLTPTSIIHLDIGGKVGIGNSAPYTKLDVTGVVNALSPSGFGLGMTSGNPNGDGGMYWSTNLVLFSSVGGMQLFTGGSERARLSSSGNFGIGTTNPQSLLHLSSGTTTVMQMSNTAGSADAKNWTVQALSSNILRHTVLDDAQSGGATWLDVTRSGATVSSVVFPNGSVGVGVTSPNAAAILQVDSTTKGFLPPRMTTAQRNAISSPPAGLVIYNTDTSSLEVFT